MRLWARLFAISALLLTAACAPFVTVDYYRPEAPEGEVARAHCPPVNSFILFKNKGVLVGVGHLHQSEDRLSRTCVRRQLPGISQEPTPLSACYTGSKEAHERARSDAEKTAP